MSVGASAWQISQQSQQDCGPLGVGRGWYLNKVFKEQKKESDNWHHFCHCVVCGLGAETTLSIPHFEEFLFEVKQRPLFQ